MRVLWITNSPFPEATSGEKPKSPVKGWVYAAANGLIEKYKDLSLAVVSTYNGNETKEIKTDDRINHYLIPKKVRTDVNNSTNNRIWIQLKDQFNPDLIHIHGSEYPHSYSYVRACGAEKVVVSIQGLVSVYEKYYYGNIEKLDLLKSITLRDLVRFDTTFTQHKNMMIRGGYEKLLLQTVNHIIGRTSWDKVHTWAINPNANYHFCNETLRPSFYTNTWSIDNCEKHSIFISQGHYPIKGFHQLINAMPIVLRHYPHTKVYVAGTNYFSGRGIRLTGFGKYINSLIKKYKLDGHFIFTGALSEEGMCQRFINSHLFISPSAIENSPNSVGEAQLLGVPCIASNVGGTSDMIDHDTTGLLYRFEESEMLSGNICRIFSDDNLALRLSAQGKIAAAKRHNKEQNAAALRQIYEEIIAKK
ncbi:MAG: glycosyltransferase family 4 protein [Mangrovibacterium sp.]